MLERAAASATTLPEVTRGYLDHIRALYNAFAAEDGSGRHEVLLKEATHSMVEVDALRRELEDLKIKLADAQREAKNERDNSARRMQALETARAQPVEPPRRAPSRDRTMDRILMVWTVAALLGVCWLIALGGSRWIPRIM
ncbi:Chromosome partition protein Smc [Carpediemonas membranifera]|uniref:Chromosome partition protein Smc n=1 Tax=Carpediemonas membranifera TaxID=201153 RepID=A0A8J6BB61_9EUKA|nr:Chromosome partition protein Smc [Carpediemonas membranifera]|eukprot:KAG9396617.1 Chromosome partition protein Smc [Carpediemonas membranifera]